MQRRSQELMWDSVIDPTERQIEELIARYESLTGNDEKLGSLKLSPNLEIPRYHTAADIHLQPGGYHTDFTENDVTAGALYEAGLPIYIGGALGPDSDYLGQLLANFCQNDFPELKVNRVLDMGCGVGNSTLPWHKAYPNAVIHAIDVAAPCLRYGHARAELYEIPIHFRQQNAEATDYDENSYDLIVSHIMLHETSHSALLNIFKECRRLLRPGGIMLHMEIPRGSEPFEQFMFQWETYNNNETFARYMTEIDLTQVAIKAGFAEEKTAMIGMNSGFSEQQKNYNDGDFVWPVLYGRKHD